MRIKSYFAPTVQAAIALARQEFGDGVTLVTSHVAAPENRVLGEYEVVFAVEGEAAAVPTPEAPCSAALSQERSPEAAPFHEFQALLLQAVAAPASTTEQLPQKLAHLRGCLIELGLPAAGVLQVMSLVEQLAGIGNEPEVKRQIQPVHRQKEEVVSSSPTSAELLFSQSVANPGTRR